MVARHGLLMMPLTAALAGCGGTPEPGVYDIPIQTVYERLSVSDMDDFRTGRQCGILIHFAIEGQTNQSVRWVVTSSGREVASFTATLTPVTADRTRITISVPSAPDGGEIYDGKQFYPRPAIYQPLRPALTELVAARLEQRPFDVWRIPDDVRANDSVCSVQRAGLESGSVRFRADGNDDMGRRGSRDDFNIPAPIVPGQPMSSAKPSR